MNKLQHLTIQQFHGLENVTINNCTALNIIVGENNTGKTSILEAIKLLSNPLSQLEFNTLARSRERAHFPMQKSNTIEAIKWLFLKKEGFDHSPIQIQYTFI